MKIESPVEAVSRVLRRSQIEPSNVLVMMLIDAVRETTPPPREVTIGMLTRILQSLDPASALDDWAVRSSREIVKILSSRPEIKHVAALVDDERKRFDSRLALGGIIGPLSPPPPRYKPPSRPLSSPPYKPPVKARRRVFTRSGRSAKRLNVEAQISSACHDQALRSTGQETRRLRGRPRPQRLSACVQARQIRCQTARLLEGQARGIHRPAYGAGRGSQ